MIKFVDINGASPQARRAVSGGSSVQDEALTDPQQVGEQFRRVIQRVVTLEGRQPPNAVEIEKEVTAAGTTYLFEHGFNSPVRWWVVDWSKTATATPVIAPILVRDQSATTADILALKSHAAGKVIVRIEPSQFTVTAR